LQLELEETGQVMIREFGEGILATLPWGDDSTMRDITDKVVALGLTAKTFSELAGGTEDLEAWAEAMERAGQNAKDVTDVYTALLQERARLRLAEDAAKITQQFVGTTTTTAPVVTTTTQPTVNQTIIYPPGVTPTATAVSGNLYLSRNGVRTGP